MSKVDLAKKNREHNEESYQFYYENEILRLIRMKYRADQEFAILRQRDSKPEEFAAYNEYVEECKRKVKEMFGEVEEDDSAPVS